VISFDVIPAYLLTGAVAGFFAGLLGVGGGVVVVPLLTVIFAGQGFPANEVMHLALGTSMATILFTSISSLRAHHAHRAVLWPVMRDLTPGVLVGTPSRNLPGRGGLGLAGTVIGTLASLAAMGGGALTVPYLIWCNVRPHQAIGTSAAVGLPIAIGGTIGYVWNGWGHPGLPAGSLGFIYLPALAVILLASVLAAPLGARLAHRLPVVVLKRIFAGLLLVLSSKMLWSLYGS
jgi:uncharacterized membrane protein YfcA